MEEGLGLLFISLRSFQFFSKTDFKQYSISYHWFDFNWIKKLYVHDSLLMNRCRVLSSYTFDCFGLSTSVLGYFNGSTTTDCRQTDREQRRRLAEKGDPKYIFTIPRAILPKPSLCDEVTVTKSM